jgi:hypothetical protein
MTPPAILRVLLPAVVFTLGGCATPTEPARLSQPSPLCLRQIEAFASAQTGAPVSLTPNAFAASSELLLEPGAALKLSGRLLGQPERFQLLRAGARCVIRDPARDVQRPLDACHCAAPA